MTPSHKKPEQCSGFFIAILTKHCTKRDAEDSTVAVCRVCAAGTHAFADAKIPACVSATPPHTLRAVANKAALEKKGE